MSTSHALMDLVEEITSSIDAKKISIGVIIDLKKAFDTVNHTLLIDKLEYYGIRGIAQEWLKSYLKDRKQFVQIDECASTLLNVTCGVPQGSILGPQLFILYINDICNASTSLKFILFADDTNVFYSGVDIQTICECISRELDKLHVWLSVNKLSLNVDKTNFILFGNRKNIDNVCISMNNSIITRVRATKFLGVIIYEKLTWKDHISLVRSKLSKTVGILSWDSTHKDCRLLSFTTTNSMMSVSSPTATPPSLTTSHWTQRSSRGLGRLLQLSLVARLECGQAPSCL